MKLSIYSSVLVLSTVLAGCGNSGVELVPFSGVVREGNKPVSNALVKFIPTEGRESFARTDENGQFELMYTLGRPGIVPGEYDVMIMTGGEGAIPAAEAAPIPGAEMHAVAMTPSKRGRTSVVSLDPVIRYPSKIKVDSDESAEPLDIDLSVIASQT